MKQLPKSIDARSEPSRQPRTASASEPPKRISRSKGEILFYSAVAALIVLFAWDLGVTEPSPNHLDCRAQESDILSCAVKYSPPSSGFGFFKRFGRKIISEELCLTLIIGLLTLRYTVKNIMASFEPYVTFSYRQELSEVGDRLRVRIRNDGRGTAVGLRSFYWIRFLSDDGGSEETWKTASEVRDLLEAKYAKGDFEFTPIGDGGAIPVGSEINVFSSKLNILQVVDVFDLLLEYRGQLGGVFRKRVIFVPAVGEERNNSKLRDHEALRHLTAPSDTAQAD